MKKYTIAQIGSFDVENYGDLLFENVFSVNIKKYLDIEDIILFAPKNCDKPFENEKKVYSVTELEEVYLEKPFDAIVVGGGDLIHFRKLLAKIPYISDSLVEYEALYMWIAPIMLSIKYNIPLVWNSPGVPFEFSDNEKEIVKCFLENIDYISFRDDVSKKYLLESGTKCKINTSIDSVLSLSSIFSKDYLKKYIEKLKISDPYIVFHANKNYIESEIDDVVNQLVEITTKENLKIVLMPIGYALGDVDNLRKIKNKLAARAISFDEKLSPFEMMALISYSKCYIGSSLHGLITATSYEIPNIVINNYKATKIVGFLEKIDRSDSLLDRIEELSEKYEEIMTSDFSLDKKFLYEIDENLKKMSKVIKEKCQNKKIIPAFIKVMDSLSISNQIVFKEKHIINLENMLDNQNKTVERLQNQIETMQKAIDDKEQHIVNISNQLSYKDSVITRYNKIEKTRIGRIAVKVYNYKESKGEK